eukprot:scaffold47388_cov38-Tisochrysis_lutea.AAC.2
MGMQNPSRTWAHSYRCLPAAPRPVPLREPGSIALAPHLLPFPLPPSSVLFLHPTIRPGPGPHTRNHAQGSATGPNPGNRQKKEWRGGGGAKGCKAGVGRKVKDM